MSKGRIYTYESKMQSLNRIPILSIILEFHGQPRSFSLVSSSWFETVEHYGHSYWERVASMNQLKKALRSGYTIGVNRISTILERREEEEEGRVIDWTTLFRVVLDITPGPSFNPDLNRMRRKMIEHVYSKQGVNIDFGKKLIRRGRPNRVNICELIALRNDLETMKMISPFLNEDRIQYLLRRQPWPRTDVTSYLHERLAHLEERCSSETADVIVFNFAHQTATVRNLFLSNLSYRQILMLEKEGSISHGHRVIWAAAEILIRSGRLKLDQDSRSLHEAYRETGSYRRGGV